MTRPRSFFAALAIVAATVSTSAHAQDAPDAGARAAFDEGVRAAQRDAWDEALEHFRRADALLVNPNIRINLAAALVQTLRLREAEALYGRILEEHADELDAAQRAELRAVRERVEHRIPTLEVRLRDAPEPLTIEVDTEDAVQTAGATTLRLDPGEHELRVRRGDEVLATRHVRLEEVRRMTLVIPVAVRDDPPPAPRETSWPALLSTLGGAALVTATIGTSIAIADLQNDPDLVAARAAIPSYENVCDDPASPSIASTCGQAAALEAAQWGLLAVGVAALAFGAVLFVIDAVDRSRAHAEVTLRAFGGPGLAALELTVGTD